MTVTEILGTLNKIDKAQDNINVLVEAIERLSPSDRHAVTNYLVAWFCDRTPVDEWREAVNQALKVIAKK